MRALIAVGAALGALLAAADARADDCTETGVGDLGFPLVEHSCFHTEFGPFQSVVATEGAVPTVATANVDQVHTHYTITLTAGSANVVTYQPVRSGNWVVFGDDAPRLRLVDEQGATQPIRFVQAQVACAGLARGQVYALEAFQRYAIVFEPSPATRTIVVLEKISDFVAQYGFDADGDLVGGSEDLVSTPCVPPPGYLDSIDDCDDDAPTIHPGAAERCDGVDDDCDGVSDEGACAVTGGGCDASVGGAGGWGAVLVLAVALRRRRRRSASALVAVVVAVSVAAPGLARAERCEHLGPTLVDHTCLHARLGPFQDATAAPLVASASDDVDAVHTLHRVALAPTATGEHGGWVSYRPERSGDWAIYLGTDAPIAVRGPTGAVVPWVHDDQVPRCPFFARVRMLELQAGQTYRVEFGPTTATRVGVAFEYVDDFVVLLGRDADGDGFGDPDATAVSACEPPSGYVADDRDCDDGDPAISPAAIERCDAGDSNCNGSDDDVGLPCTAGEGACAAMGVSSCPVAGQPARCDAVATPAGAERCDGVDGDCDGVADIGEVGLCPDDAQPRCVGDSRGGRACGCEVDADCGGPRSGRLCWLDGLDQRCVDGCVDGFARNGCAEGQRCTSSDPAVPGSCVEAPAPADDAATGCGCQGAPRADLGVVLAVLVVLLSGRRRRPRAAALL